MTPRLVVYKNPVCSFNANWIAPIMDPYLKFEPWVPNSTYDPGTIFYINFLDFNKPGAREFCQQRSDQGFRVIIDNLWEVNAGPVPYALTVCSSAWFWYNESLWYRYLKLNQYRPQRSLEYLALMPMNLQKSHRDDFIRAVNPLLDRMLWSYVAQGRQLPNDGDMNNWDTQRRMNTEWYDSTYMSMVVETNVSPGSKYTPIFITEKTFKPIAFQHPFVVYGNCGTLRRLHEWGFETWDHLWDESYDEIQDVNARRDAVVNLLTHIEIVKHDQQTLQKLQHNHDHFFDENLVRSLIIKEIVEPILEYAETNF